MSARPTLTAAVLTKNEARHIGACLATLEWADERLVIDSGSTDATVDLARAAGARVLVHPFRDFADQRNAALAAITTDWVLFVDADERVTPGLAAEARRLIARPTGPAGYWIPRRNRILGRWMGHTGWWPDHQLRLFQARLGRYDPQRVVHETLILDGSADYLEQPLLHLNYDSLGQFFAKQIHYSRLEATRLHAAGVRPRPRSLIGQPLRELHRRYITWRGYRDGGHGLLLSVLLAWFTLVTYLRLVWRERGDLPPGPRTGRSGSPTRRGVSRGRSHSASSARGGCNGPGRDGRRGRSPSAASERGSGGEVPPRRGEYLPPLPEGKGWVRGRPADDPTTGDGVGQAPSSPAPGTLAIIIVSYNVRDLLAECLRSVREDLAECDRPGEIVVVDNASIDGSADLADLAAPGVRLIRNRENVGFGRAVNQAIAMAEGAEYFLLLNPDARVLPGALPALVGYLNKHPEVAIVGPQLLHGDGSVQSSRRRFPTLLTGFIESTRLQRHLAGSAHLRRYYAADLPDDREAEVDWLVGACLLVRRAAIDRIGGLDERFFMYFEEVDWCLRLRRAGWRIVYFPAARVVHHYGRSAAQDVARRQILFDASKRAYYRKHFGPGVELALRLFLATTYVFQAGEEAAKLAFGHRRDLRRRRLAEWRRILAAA